MFIFGWNAGLVKDSIRNYHASALVCTPSHYFPLHMRNIAGWFLDNVLMPYVLRYLPTHGLLQIGEPGKGKTPVAEILAFQLSIYLILDYYAKEGNMPAKVMYKITSNLDFLRGEPGSTFLPIIVDDLDLPSELTARIKAVLAVGEVKSLTYQRWSSASFVQGQPRIINANQYDASADPNPSGFINIKHPEFYAMIQGSFHEKATRADIMAILKRSVVLLTTKTGVYARIPSGEEAEVPFIPFDNKTDFIEDEAKHTYKSYKQGSRGKEKERGCSTLSCASEASPGPVNSKDDYGELDTP